jgi:hypothetical protein
MDSLDFFRICNVPNSYYIFIIVNKIKFEKIAILLQFYVNSKSVIYSKCNE